MKILVISLAFFAISAYFTNYVDKPKIIIDKQNQANNYNTTFLSLVSFGNKRLFADWIFIQTLLEGDIDHYKKGDFNNWMFLRFKTIIELDPFFLQAYQFGGQYLSIIKDDDLGAKEIYDRGLKVYPNDYFLIWNTAYHYYYELHDLEMALKLYRGIVNHPNSPKYLPSLVAILESRQGDMIAALELLEVAIRRVDQKSLIFKNSMELNAISLKLEIDLECLNSKSKDCNLYRPDGYRYILKDGTYTTDKPFRPFKLFSKDK